MPGDPDWQPVFAPAGKTLKEGDFISRMAYSQTLQKIAENGVEAFYTVRSSFLSFLPSSHCTDVPTSRVTSLNPQSPKSNPKAG